MSLYHGQKISIDSKSTDFTALICGGCGIEHFMPSNLYEALKENKSEFWCPRGCNRIFTGPTKAERLQKEFDKEKKILEEKNRDLHYKLIEKEKDRVKLYNKLRASSKRKCPHCTGSYLHLAGHIKRQHSDKK